MVTHNFIPSPRNSYEIKGQNHNVCPLSSLAQLKYSFWKIEKYLLWQESTGHSDKLLQKNDQNSYHHKTTL
jgi:hypothetical protein